MVTKDDLKAELEMSDVVTIDLDDGYSYQVGDASNWIGGSEGRFMSDLLGNVEYGTMEGVIDGIFTFLAEKGRVISEVR